MGKPNILGFRERYPAQVDYEPRQLRGGGDKVQRDLPARLPDRRG